LNCDTGAAVAAGGGVIPDGAGVAVAADGTGVLGGVDGKQEAIKALVAALADNTRNSRRVISRFNVSSYVEYQSSFPFLTRLWFNLRDTPPSLHLSPKSFQNP
jgi:hypothetical protein